MFRFSTAVIGCLIATGTVAAADNFPSGPIQLIAPTNPGSGADQVARFFCAQLSAEIKQPCVVENRPGANSVIGTTAVLRAPANGYTLVLGANSPMAVNVAIIKDLPYDPLKDFKPIYGLAKHSNVIVVPANSSIKSLRELIAEGKKRQLNAGVGASLYELATHWMSNLTGADFLQVPYKGFAPLSVDMLSNRLDFSIVDLAGAKTLLRSGKLRPLAVLGDTPHPDFPDVPTAASVIPTMVNYSWTAIYVRSEVPDDVTNKLVDAFRKVMAKPEATEFIRGINLELLPLGPKEMRAFQVSEIERFKSIAAAANFKPQ